MKRNKMKYHILIILLLTALSSQAQFITNNGISLNNTARIITNGDWVNSAGTVILNNGIITTNSSFRNLGTLDPASTGGFVLKFPTDLNFQPGGSAMGFLTKDNVGAALVSGTISVKDSLHLKNGLIRMLSATDTVSIRNGAALVGSGPLSYVEGLMARAGNGDFTFPIGRDGLYLPVKTYKSQAQKITASVILTPGGHTAGPGVSALIGFPYAWKLDEKVTADTSAYVEVNYPNSLPVVGNPIVVRQIPGSKFESMGARFTSNNAGRVTVRSYSRRLKGLYSVAQGFPQNLATDSLALVTLYNATGGPTWTTKTNWLTGQIGTWSGITLTGQSITAINLPTNNLTGTIPEPLVDIVALQTVNLSGNNITAIPTFTSNAQIATLNVSNNKLNFSTLEPNASVPGFSYSNQADLGLPIDTLLAVGSPYQFTVNAGGVNSQYIWKRNGSIVSGANAPVYSLTNINRTNMGDYVSEITNSLLPGLTLRSALKRAIAYANISGKLFADVNIGASNGKLTLFRITPTAYDTVGTVNVSNDGSYVFPKAVLDDYQLLGFADTLTYPRALPTYYTSTIFWEEADTLFLLNNVNNLNIVSQLEPAPPSGKGTISGYFEEDDGTGRLKKTLKPKRVKSAGVSARRVENTGRAKAEILTLVAYVFTNDEGEFILPELPTGEYRLNIQYPGYPMDENSFITIPIGTAFKSNVSVQANVENGKINVKKIIITGTHDSENYDVDVYPNPAVEFIRLGFGAESKGRAVSLFDVNGKAVLLMPAEGKEALVNVQDRSKGIYFLRINENGETVKTLKVSIE